MGDPSIPGAGISHFSLGCPKVQDILLKFLWANKHADSDTKWAEATVRVALGINVFLGRLEVRSPIPPLPLLEKPLELSASCHICLGREKALPCPSWCQEQDVPGCRAQPPPSVPHSPPGQPGTPQVCASAGDESGPWQLEEDSPGGDGDATGAALHGRSSPVEISKRGGGRFAKGCFFLANLLPVGARRPTPPGGCAGRGTPQAPQSPRIEGSIESSIVPTSRQANGGGGVGGVERLGAIKQLGKPR